jgi:hypothetical protein
MIGAAYRRLNNDADYMDWMCGASEEMMRISIDAVM